MNATPHRHAEKIKQWADSPEWWDVYFREPATSAWTKVLTSPGWAPDYEYELRKSAKHPDNKPKKRLIDWSKMPIGTMTNRGEIRAVFGDFVQLEVREKNIPKYDLTIPQNLRLAEQTQFTYWDGKGNPVPEGVVAEYKYIISSNGKPTVCVSKHLMSEHVAIGVGYRITGLADGWTDVPEEAV